jgi:hypothetical protein
LKSSVCAYDPNLFLLSFSSSSTTTILLLYSLTLSFFLHLTQTKTQTNKKTRRSTLKPTTHNDEPKLKYTRIKNRMINQR